MYSCADRNWMILLQHANVHVRLLVNYRMDLWNSASVSLATKTGGAQAVLWNNFESNSKLLALLLTSRLNSQRGIRPRGQHSIFS